MREQNRLLHTHPDANAALDRLLERLLAMGEQQQLLELQVDASISSGTSQEAIAARRIYIDEADDLVNDISMALLNRQVTFQSASVLEDISTKLRKHINALGKILDIPSYSEAAHYREALNNRAFYPHPVGESDAFSPELVARLIKTMSVHGHPADAILMPITGVARLLSPEWEPFLILETSANKMREGWLGTILGVLVLTDAWEIDESRRWLHQDQFYVIDKTGKNAIRCRTRY